MRTLYRILSGNSLFTVIILAVIASLLWIPSLMDGSVKGFEYTADPMPLFGFLAWLFDGYARASVLFAFIIFFLTAFLLDYLNTKFILVQERTFLPVWFFILITSVYPGIYRLDPVLPAALFIVLMVHFIFAAYKANPNCYRFFEAGLAVGVAGLFYAPAIWFILLIWISALILRPFYWREWLHPLLGIFSVFSLAWGYYYLIHGNPSRFFILLSINLKPEFMKFEPDINVLIGSVYLFITIIFSSFFMLRIFQFSKVYARNYFLIFFWLFLISLGFFFYPSGGNYGLVYVMSFPVAYLNTNYFVNARNIQGNRILFGIGLLLLIGVTLNRVFFGL